MTNTNIEIFKKRLSSYTGEIKDVCYDLHTLIQGIPTESQNEAFEFICENFAILESDKSYVAPSNPILLEKYKIYEPIWGSVIKGILGAILKQAINSGYEKKQFYAEVWQHLINNPIFNEELLQSFALFYVLVDSRIPYWKIDSGVSMDDEEYRAVLLQNEEVGHKISFVMSLDFDQKTQRASNLLDIILKAPDRKTQIVLLSKIVKEASQLATDECEPELSQ